MNLVHTISESGIHPQELCKYILDAPND